MKKGILLISAAIVLILFTSNKKEPLVYNASDNTVKIGKQVWMAENLDVDTYRNGDSIPQVKSPEKWSTLKTGAWCYFDNKIENGHKYGRLYNWYAVNDPRGLAPAGFHVPSDKEWEQLMADLDNEETAAKLKSKRGWKENKEATDETGFGALPGGYRVFNGPFIYEGSHAFFWSATSVTPDKAWGRGMLYNHVDVGRDEGSKGSGLSVRCIQD
jgi:uncharacterized protein (TIGR02145 family)